MKTLLIATLFIFPVSLAAFDGPCAEDRKIHCSDIEKGKGRIQQCLKNAEAKLSSQCKEALAERKEKREDVKLVCAEDVQKLCPHKKKLIKCLKSQKEKLSEACKNKVKELKKHKDQA